MTTGRRRERRNYGINIGPREGEQAGTSICLGRSGLHMDDTGDRFELDGTLSLNRKTSSFQRERTRSRFERRWMVFSGNRCAERVDSSLSLFYFLLGLLGKGTCWNRSGERMIFFFFKNVIRASLQVLLISEIYRSIRWFFVLLVGDSEKNSWKIGKGIEYKNKELK